MENILNGDVKYMKKLIGKHVEIKLRNGNCFAGIIYVIDPVTKSIILYNKVDNDTSIILFSENTILSFKCIDNLEESEASTNNLFKKVLTEEEHEKRINLKNWLNKHCINVEDDGRTLKLGDDLVIESPYDTNSCFSGNGIILERVKGIIENLEK